MKKHIFCLFFACLLCGNPLLISAQQDKEGSEDHPMISRYEGSYITGYEQYEYDRLALATGVADGEVQETVFEGKVTRIHYVAPEGRSSLEVHRNYQMALAEAGFEIVYECAGDSDECSNLDDFKIDGTKFGELSYMGKDPYPYHLYARLPDSEGDILVTVTTALRGGPNSVVQVVEEKSMETGKIAVDPDARTDARTDAGDYQQAREDPDGSKDHPMISRYEGSYITGYEQYEYDRLALATGVADGEVQETVFEGKVTRIHYVAPEGRSSLEVHRNYQMALAEAGFEIVYECAGDSDECSNLDDFKIDGTKFGELSYMGKDPYPYHLYARLPDSEGDILVTVTTALRGGPNSVVQVVEEKSMETGKVDVDIDAAAMASNIDEKGSVRIYGIHFDTDKATIKEESESTLAEIAALLEQNPDLRLGVVGHTDAIGDMEYNMGLSRKRAEAVVDFLSSDHGISENRLTPRGAGSLAPVASNEDEDGRAQNRRVELIKMIDQ